MGVPLTDYAAIRSVTSRDPEMVLVGALNTWFSSVIGCETFHADVHAGVMVPVPEAHGIAGCAGSEGSSSLQDEGTQESLPYDFVFAWVYSCLFHSVVLAL